MSTSIIKDNKISVIGIGGAGGKIVAELSELQLANVSTILIDKKWEHEDGNVEGIIEINDSVQLERLTTYIQDSETVVFFAGLGKETGTNGVKTLLEEDWFAGKEVYAFVSIPFVFEGLKAKKRALETINKLKESSFNLHVLENDSLFKDEKTKNAPLIDLIKEGNKQLLSEFLKLVV